MIGTAILLARRSVWYDSGLLVGLEQCLIFVPFILVSQALLIEGPIAFIFCVAGLTLAVARAGALKVFLRSFNMSRALLWAGLFLLAVNVALPVLTRLLHQDANIPLWDIRKSALTHIEWFAIAPLGMALANFLPHRIDQRSPNGNESAYYARPWFPVSVLGLWVAGTCAHLYCIGYVYG